MRRAVAGLALVIGLLAALPAAAHEKAFDSRVTIHNPEGGPNWKGRVFSESSRCVAGRTVKFFRANGERVGTPFETDADGRWSFGFVGSTGYYAKVTREVRGGSGHRHICRADRSRTISGLPY